MKMYLFTIAIKWQIVGLLSEIWLQVVMHMFPLEQMISRSKDKKLSKKTQSISFKNRSILMKIQDGHECLYSKKLNIHNWIYAKEQKHFIGMSWTCRKKSGQSNNFWVSYGPLKDVYKWSKISFSWITPKVLTFKYYTKNKNCSGVNFICMYRIWSKLIEN